MCDKIGYAIVFDDEKDAREYLYMHGMTESEIEDEGIIFEKQEDEG